MPSQEQDRLPLRVYLTPAHRELTEPTQTLTPGAGTSGRGGVNGGRVVEPLSPWLGDGGLLSWNRVKIFADGSLGESAGGDQAPRLGALVRSRCTRVGGEDGCLDAVVAMRLSELSSASRAFGRGSRPRFGAGPTSVGSAGSDWRSKAGVRWMRRPVAVPLEANALA